MGGVVANDRAHICQRGTRRTVAVINATRSRSQKHLLKSMACHRLARGRPTAFGNNIRVRYRRGRRQRIA
eukprot:486740-Amorphochlora_amoeboformis.AAC.1